MEPFEALFDERVRDDELSYWELRRRYLAMRSMVISRDAQLATARAKISFQASEIDRLSRELTPPAPQPPASGVRGVTGG